MLMAGWTFFGMDSLVSPPPQPNPAPPAPDKTLSKTRVKQIIRDTEFLNAENRVFFVDRPEETYTVATFLDTRLQKELKTSMERLKGKTRGKPQRIAIVAMDAHTGGVVAMTGFDLADPKANPCLASDYPAASIFKIITASAAVDALGYTAQTPLYFNGNKYTLYKRQLTEKRNRYTTRIALGNAFAESVNPVFGKLGKIDLGRITLNAYAHAFGFNQTPETDMEFESGTFGVTESDYHLAELGCGFNRNTRISPLFGAMMISPILNQGKILVPRLIDQIKTPDGEIIYKSQKEFFKNAVTPATAGTMTQLMQKTITRGTARKAFRGSSRDKILSQLVIGGKTGSLSNRKRTVKYDWFTGFATHKTRKNGLVVSIVVGHRKYIGTRAATHAKNIFKTYFKGEVEPSLAQN